MGPSRHLALPTAYRLLPTSAQAAMGHLRIHRLRRFRGLLHNVISQRRLVCHSEAQRRICFSQDTECLRPYCQGLPPGRLQIDDCRLSIEQRGTRLPISSVFCALVRTVKDCPGGRCPLIGELCVICGRGRFSIADCHSGSDGTVSAFPRFAISPCLSPPTVYGLLSTVFRLLSTSSKAFFSASSNPRNASSTCRLHCSAALNAG
jgi:hypothetical protein